MTKTQVDALRRIRDHGSLAWCSGRGRAGGAIARMFDHMAVMGYCTRPPYYITDLGRNMVTEFEKTEKCDICGELRTNVKTSCSMSFHRSAADTEVKG